MIEGHPFVCRWRQNVTLNQGVQEQHPDFPANPQPSVDLELAPETQPAEEISAKAVKVRSTSEGKL